MNTTDYLPGFFFGFSILLLAFVVGREIVCWYWKINRIVDLLEDIEYNTRKEKEKDGTNEKKGSN